MITKQTPLIFNLPENGGKADLLPACGGVPKLDLNKVYGSKLREELPLPQLSEVQVVRHFTELSNKNFGVDSGPYPLGSCTMKYNPKVHEDMAALPGFANVHPLQPAETCQGSLKVLYEHEAQLCELTGMDAFTSQPAAGAHGELCGVKLIQAYHESRGDVKRNVMLIPDSAHGTNPASAAMAGYKIREIKSNAKGLVDLEDLKAKMGDDVAGMMLTNPNTLGIFETEVEAITTMVHEAGGLMYYDGANLNAIMMHVRPGDMGFDVVHLNVHKTLSTPHGGGGPGAGPVGCKKILEPFLPTPVVVKKGEKFELDYDRPQTIGKLRGFVGSFAVLLRSYAYCLELGHQGLKEASESAVANATWLYNTVKDHYVAPVTEPCMHEFIITSEALKEKVGVTTSDVAKRLIDYGFHPPTVYFPLIVHEGMMVEPTETETMEGLEGLAEAFIAIAREAHENPALVKGAPHGTAVERPDEVKAAKEPVLKA